MFIVKIQRMQAFQCHVQHKKLQKQSTYSPWVNILINFFLLLRTIDKPFFFKWRSSFILHFHISILLSFRKIPRVQITMVSSFQMDFESYLAKEKCFQMSHNWMLLVLCENIRHHNIMINSQISYHTFWNCTF